MALIGSQVVGEIARDTERFQERFQLQKDHVFATTEDVGQHLAGTMINRVPEPALILLATDKRPHFINFRLINLVNRHRYVLRIQGR